MTKVVLSIDEWYPVHTLDRDLSSDRRAIFDVPEELVNEWEQAAEAFHEACDKLVPYFDKK